ncbi:hypothetical protein M378DRAFT_157664 [Amanita muscaria Koide BX008]|uniref:Uncharacterized protein n=1 Tax=Amanita muscaria (strain Koide BX008) TaxID=946122 RepID=A0A0C2TQ83_AMAMK|nr:hypothetical protein M378DRAFT_157664 [Amanita muscaria Koide BX008]
MSLSYLEISGSGEKEATFIRYRDSGRKQVQVAATGKFLPTNTSTVNRVIRRSYKNYWRIHEPEKRKGKITSGQQDPSFSCGGGGSHQLHTF